jgi:two-component system chemotaxis response regulator CheB
MAGVRVVRRWNPTPERVSVAPPPIIAEGRKADLLAIATSTGGPGALYRIFSELSADFPVPILVVQHIAHGFVSGLAAWLNGASKLRVKVASDGERIQPGCVYIAPDDVHLGLRDRNTLDISSANPVAGFRPPGTFLFESVARVYGNRALALVLTGMGEDGLPGLRAMHNAGAQVIAQDEETSVVFGMPGAAVAAGIADSVLPLDLIAGRLLRLCGRDELRTWKQHD